MPKLSKNGLVLRRIEDVGNAPHASALAMLRYAPTYGNLRMMVTRSLPSRNDSLFRHYGRTVGADFLDYYHAFLRTFTKIIGQDCGDFND